MYVHVFTLTPTRVRARRHRAYRYRYRLASYLLVIGIILIMYTIYFYPSSASPPLCLIGSDVELTCC